MTRSKTAKAFGFALTLHALLIVCAAHPPIKKQLVAPLNSNPVEADILAPSQNTSQTNQAESNALQPSNKSQPKPKPLQTPSTKAQNPASQQQKSNINKGNGGGAALSGNNNASALLARIQETNLLIDYDLWINGERVDLNAVIQLKFRVTGSQYEAGLMPRSNKKAFGVISVGDIRSNALATRESKFWLPHKLLAQHPDDYRGNFKAAYAEHKIFSTSGGAADLNHEAVLDFLSAIMLTQATLQASSGKVSQISLPIGHYKNVVSTQINIGSAETIEALGQKISATPANVTLPNGGIESIKVWFSAQHHYRPLQIQVIFSDGKAVLIANKTN
jgi:hypothetical protein